MLMVKSAEASFQSRVRVSIVIPVWNAGATLRRCLEEIIALNLVGCEMIVMDGGSTDNSCDIIREYHPHLAVWKSEPDRGVYDAMNKGARLARGDWLLFLGADDRLLEGFRLAVARLSDPRVIYYGDVLMPSRGIRYDGVFRPLKLARRNICHQGIFYPRSLWKDGGYDLRYPVMADYAFNLARFGDKRFTWRYLPLVVAEFNDSAGISQSRGDEAFESDRLSLVKENLPFHAFAFAVVWFGGLRVLKRMGLYDALWRLKMAFARKFAGRSA